MHSHNEQMEANQFNIQKIVSDAERDRAQLKNKRENKIIIQQQ